VTLLPLWPRAGEPAKRVILQARRGAKGPDRVLPGLVLHEGAGWSAEAERVLRDGAALGAA
jgi:tRNA1(Val) A37 N6-methylase TrmN6